MIYLDSAATSFLKPTSVEKAVIRAIHTMASPGRGSYRQAMLAADTVYDCREKISELMNLKDTEHIVFTLNATHGLNIAIKSMVHKGDRVVISGYEHNSVTRVLNALGADIAVASAPLFDEKAAFQSIENEITDAKLVICSHVSNVFGFVQPIYAIAELCKKHNVPLVIDASQSAGVYDIDAEKLKAAFIAMPGHKGLLGPQGTGVLLSGYDAEPLLYGGTGSDSISQSMPSFLPDRLEAGTQNIPGIAGLSAGVKYVLNKTPGKIRSYEKHLCRLMIDRLKHIEELELFCTDNDCQSGVLSLRPKELETERLCEDIGVRGVAARCGLHCAPLAHKTAGTLSTGTLRLSFSPFLREKDILTAAAIIENAIVHKK